MKAILLLVASLCVMTTRGQTINLKESVSTQIIFPTEIEHFRGGFSLADFREPYKYKNILYIQPFGEFEPTNISVITIDGLHYALKLFYNKESFETYYVVEKNKAIFSTGTIEKSSISTPVVSEMPTVSKILTEKGYITTRNGVRYKSLSLRVSGIYTSGNEIFIRLSIENRSQIAYKIEHVGFTIKPLPTAKLSVSLEESVEPITYFAQHNVVSAQAQVEIVCGFNQFTIGQENSLVVDLIEAEGARNISLTITDETLLSAQKI